MMFPASTLLYISEGKIEESIRKLKEQLHVEEVAYPELEYVITSVDKETEIVTLLSLLSAEYIKVSCVNFALRYQIKTEKKDNTFLDDDNYYWLLLRSWYYHSYWFERTDLKYNERIVNLTEKQAKLIVSILYSDGNIKQFSEKEILVMKKYMERNRFISLVKVSNLRNHYVDCTFRIGIYSGI